MAARRCGLCGINYPPEDAYRACPVHDSPTQWMSSLVPDEYWDWKATLLLQKSGDVLPRVQYPPRERPDGLYELSGLAVRGHPWRPSDGDVFETGPKGAPLPEDGPCDCLWEVLFRHPAKDAWIVKPLRVPDA